MDYQIQSKVSLPLSSPAPSDCPTSGENVVELSQHGFG